MELEIRETNRMLPSTDARNNTSPENVGHTRVQTVMVVGNGEFNALYIIDLTLLLVKCFLNFKSA